MTAWRYWLLLLVPVASAQTVVSVVPGTATAGGSGSATVNITSSSSASEPVAVEWTLTYSSSVLSGMTLTAGAALTSAGKSLSCENATGSVQCVIWGLNNTAIANGVLATATFSVASTAPASSTLGLTALSAVSSAATSIAATATGATLTIHSSSSSGGSSAPAVSKLSCASASLTTPAEVECTVTLTSAATEAMKIDLGMDYVVSELTVPRTVTIAAGESSASYEVSATKVTTAVTAILVADFGGHTATFDLALLP